MSYGPRDSEMMMNEVRTDMLRQLDEKLKAAIGKLIDAGLIEVMEGPPIITLEHNVATKFNGVEFHRFIELRVKGQDRIEQLEGEVAMHRRRWEELGAMLEGMQK